MWPQARDNDGSFYYFSWGKKLTKVEKKNESERK